MAQPLQGAAGQQLSKSKLLVLLARVLGRRWGYSVCVGETAGAEQRAPALPFPFVYPAHAGSQRLSASLFNSIRILETNETPIDGEWLNKLRHVHTMQSLRALKKNAAALQARWRDSPQDRRESSEVGPVLTVCCCLGCRQCAQLPVH